ALKLKEVQQTPRLSGKEGKVVAYDASEAMPTSIDIEPNFRGLAKPADLKSILDEIATPGIIRTRDAKFLRPETMPPILGRAIDPFRPPDDEDNDFRKAVKTAVKTLNEQMNKPYKDGYEAKMPENLFKNEVLADQKAAALPYDT